VIRNLRQLKPMALSLSRKPEDGIFWWAVFCILLQFFFANNVVHAIVGHSVNMRVHPANIIILFCAIYVLLRGGMSFHERCRQSPGLVLYVFGIPLFSLYTIYFNGLSGAAFYWDSFWGSVANFLGGHATSEDADGFIPPTNRIAERDTFRLSSATGLCGSCA
jgi:hypothetical protein